MSNTYKSIMEAQMLSSSEEEIERLEARVAEEKSANQEAGEIIGSLNARVAELEAERDDYRKRWEDTSCTRHHAMETAIKLYEAKRTRVAQLEKAMIAYLSTEGCSCCQDVEGHRAALDQIAKVFGWPQFDDGSGIDWYSRRDELENNDE